MASLCTFIGGPGHMCAVMVDDDTDQIAVPVAGPRGYGRALYEREKDNRYSFLLVHDCALSRGLSFCGQCFRTAKVRGNLLL